MLGKTVKMEEGHESSLAGYLGDFSKTNSMLMIRRLQAI